MDNHASAHQTPEGRIYTAELHRLVAQLLVDDVGREALMRIVVNELAQRTVKVRGLKVIDPFGRVRIEADATETASELRVFGFSPWDRNGSPRNWALLNANEETGGTSVHIGVCSGDESVAVLSAEERDDGVAGVPVLNLDRFERNGRYGPRGQILTDRQVITEISADGLETKAVDG